jgi:hypothetical protein
VIHLLTENSIEERVWESLRLKRALFTGLFDEAKDEISFEKLGRKSMMHVIKDVFSDQPGRPKPVLTPGPPQPVAVMETKRRGKAAAKTAAARRGLTGTGPQLPADGTMRVAQSPAQDGDAPSGLSVLDTRQAVSKFLEAGLTLLESLSSPSGADGFGPIERSLSALLRTDAHTRRPSLEIPLPESITAERLARVIAGFLGNLARSH